MEGMDDQDVRDAMEAMDRRNSRRREEWQYPRYKQPDPGFVARIMRMFGQPYDKSAIDPREAHYLNGGWDDDDDGDDLLQVKPAPTIFDPARGEERRTNEPWKLNWGKNGNVFGLPKTMEHRPDQDDGRLSYQRMPGKPIGNGQADTGTGLRLFNYGGPASYRQDALRLAYSPPSAVTSKKYIQDWYDANIWTDPDVLAAATQEEREAAIHRIIASRGGEGLLKHYNVLHPNENDAEAARMNDVKYVVGSLGRVQDTPGDSGASQDATGRLSFEPSGHDAGVHMKGGEGGAPTGNTAHGQGQVNAPQNLPPQIAGGDHLGYLSVKHEAGGNPGKISPGSGDDGGKSYGAFQFASKRGVPEQFLTWLATNDPHIYASLKAAQEADGYEHGPKFDAEWEKIAGQNPERFLKLQYDFTKQKYYDPAVAAIKEQTGFDFNNKSYALKNVLWSRAVQHGDKGVINVIKNALKYVDLNNENEEELIKAIYRESGSTDSKEGPYITEEDIRKELSPEDAEDLISFAREHNLIGKPLKYYGGSVDTLISVWKRLNINEPKDALDLLIKHR